MYVDIQKQEKIAMDLARKSQIKVKNEAQTGIRAQVGAILFEKALIIVPTKYFNYSDVFLAEYTAKLLEHTIINDDIMKLKKSKQSLFDSIYSIRSG